MNILYVTEQIYRSSGVSVWCVELCERLIEMGHNVRLAVQKPHYRSPYPVHDTNMLISTEKAIAQFEEDRWDIVHINGVWNWPYHNIAALARKRNIPVVWSLHGSLRPWAVRHKWWKKYVALFAYQKADLARSSLIHVTADNELEDLRRLRLKNQTFTAPLGVKFLFNEEQLHSIKQGYKKKDILFLGRIHPVKGLPNLIKAWSHVKQENPQLVAGWKVVIAGESSDKSYGYALKKVSEEAGVANDFEFCGSLYGIDKEYAYARARLFVLPSYSENFGSVVVESLANGTPVITTKGTPWEILEDEQCGWWVDVGVEPLTCALREALSLSVSDLCEMGHRGRSMVATRYTWDNIAKKMIAEYQKLKTNN